MAGWYAAPHENVHSRPHRGGDWERKAHEFRRASAASKEIEADAAADAGVAKLPAPRMRQVKGIPPTTYTPFGIKVHKRAKQIAARTWVFGRRAYAGSYSLVAMLALAVAQGRGFSARSSSNRKPR